MPKINLLKSETSIRLARLGAGYEKDLLSTLANTSLRDVSKYLAIIVVDIPTEAKALQHTVALVCSAIFTQALRKYAIAPEVEEATFHTFLEEINQLLKRRDTGSFDIDRFWNSELVQDYAKRLLALVADQVDEKQHTRIRVYMRDYCPLFFKELLSSETTIHNKLSQFLASPLHLAQKEKYHLDKYYTDLKHEYTSVTLNDPKGMTLDHVYQEPGFSVFNRCLTEQKRKQLKEDQKEDRFVAPEELNINDDIHSFSLRWLQGQFSNEDFDHAQARILLLYGYPGQGKTSFCKRLVHDLLEEHIDEQRLFLLRFRNIEQPELLKSEILSTVRNHLNERYKLSLDKEDLTSSLLILDGLDELLMKNNLKTSDVDEIIRSLILEIKLHPDLRFVITSRHGYLNHKELKTSELLVLSINEFDLELQKNWLTSYREFHPESWLDLGKLEEIKKGENYLQELMGQPILLHMIAALEEDITEDVPNRAKVYELLFEQLTNPKKWKDRQIDVLDGLRTEDLRLALREIAFHIFQGGKEYIHKSALEKLSEVDRLKNNLEGRGENFREALKVMMVAFYFQEKPKDRSELNDEDNYDYAIEFLHKSLQEFLTAEYIWFTIEEELLSKKARGYYILEKDEDILELLQSIFGHQPMSKEIVQYLIDIIQNDDRMEVKGELAKRMEDCFEYCLEKQFLYSFNHEKQIRAIDLSVMVFYGYMTTYSRLKEKIVLFNEGAKDRIASFAFLLKTLGASALPVREFYLPYVYLRGADLSGANLNGARFFFIHTFSLIAPIDRVLIDEALGHNDLIDIDTEFTDIIDTDIELTDITDIIDTDIIDTEPIDIDTDIDLTDLTDLIRPIRIGSSTLPLLIGTNLRDADLGSADLRGADLSDVNLSDADLGSANLSGANLSGANLRDAYLRGANLRGAYLCGAYLCGAYLCSSDLSSSDLSSADLSSADLRESDLSGADLSGANLRDAIGLSVSQMLQAKSIEGVEGISKDWLEKIRQKKKYERDNS